MLQRLKISNYALIEQVEIDFHTGFSVITGETGAGKSILLGALALVLGDRADVQTLLDNDKKCIVESEFNISKLELKDFFEKEELDYDDNLVMRREILPNGKSRAFINDTPVLLTQMRELGEKLVNIHSQHETLTLNTSDFKLDLLDSLLENPDVLSKYKSDYESFISLSRELKSLQEIDRQNQAEKDYNQFLFNELEEIKLKISEQNEIEEELEIQNNAEEIRILSEEILAKLDNSEVAVLSALSEINNSFKKLSKFSKQIEEIFERSNSAFLELKDICSEVEQFSQKIEFDQQRQQFLSERLDKINNLENKHKVHSIEDLLRIKENLAIKLENTYSNSEKIEKLTKEFADLNVKLNKSAKELHSSRLQAGNKIEKEVKMTLAELGMPAAQVKIVVEESPNFGKRGKDNIVMLFNANLGLEAKEVSKIASGGELSRLMLAIKSVITKKNLLPTIIFDEIDSGVSGDIAGKVAMILKKMSATMQVIAISHIPQIAAKADTHYLVFKEQEVGKTTSLIKKLNYDEHIFQIASMISNEKVSETALRAAKELI